MKNTLLTKAIALLLYCLLFHAATASSHHAGAATYDPTAMTEIEGVITRIYWRNPHVHFDVRVTNESGAAAQWDIESNSISILSRMGITPEILAVGQRVRLAGWPARRSATAMFATNLLLPDGPEVLLNPRTEARWSGATLGINDAWMTDGGGEIAGGTRDGLFRVWSTNMANPESFPLFRDVIVVEDNYPLTAAARTARENWDPVADNPYLACTPMGMPRVMGQPYPIEFVDNGDSILLRLELYDIERTILINDDANTAGIGKSSLGYSTGRWQDDTLVVRTTHVNWPYFDQSGVPLGDGAEIVERFRTDNSSGRLRYTITVTDPETFTEPVTLKKYWTWRPGERIQHYECADFDSQAPVAIKGGTFMMGTPVAYVAELRDRYAVAFPGVFENEAPAREVTVSDFLIDRYETTNARFADFLAARPAWLPANVADTSHNGAYLESWSGKDYPGGEDEHPVVFVTWQAAQAYCRWQGGRLPTEAEWEYVARAGGDSEFPWGDELPLPARANYGADDIDRTTPVGSYPANGFGVYDLAGNVWEFLYDEWTDVYDAASAADPVAGGWLTDEEIAAVEGRRAVRGASFAGSVVNLRTRWRDSHVVTNAIGFVGFRCAYPGQESQAASASEGS